jgi:hypothetical protein
MLRQDRLAWTRQTERRLELGADRQRGEAVEGECDRIGDEPTRAPQGDDVAGDHPDDRIVRARVNVAVVNQEGVRHVRQALLGFLVLTRDRFLRPVSAGHHQETRAVVEQQLLERRRRQGEAQL